jgi:GNAT superfamily N-acetyltransferase
MEPLISTIRAVRAEMVGKWVALCFGESAMSPTERARRLLEEAIELAQAEGVTLAETLKMASFVYAKPVGEPKQEAGGVALCLLGWAYGRGVDLDAIELEEIRRVMAKSPEFFRQRQAVKAEAGLSQKVVEGEIT